MRINPYDDWFWNPITFNSINERKGTNLDDGKVRSMTEIGRRLGIGEKNIFKPEWQRVFKNWINLGILEPISNSPVKYKFQKWKMIKLLQQHDNFKLINQVPII